ncbi:hypothetical protein GZH47_09020 [Paenibacillus rhizovicinus]|uniref:Uncharacterized protein n=1 Tax=Paenibacillus rhizovicinus TaxID=2704463 RepID=A0A6C0NXQ6_9BACL|nr:hypothetical protein [Paenibacillus rhizovicinus]QHW30978.1 hypothetical protein GZH47_09020 [Paenibacillus rhizovicinus]
MGLKPELLSKRIFRSGQVVPLDGLYGNMWGGSLPLLQGDLFPRHPVMGDAKWTYQGTLGMGLPQMKRSDDKRRAMEL